MRVINQDNCQKKLSKKAASEKLKIESKRRKVNLLDEKTENQQDLKTANKKSHLKHKNLSRKKMKKKLANSSISCWIMLLLVLNLLHTTHGG